MKKKITMIVILTAGIILVTIIIWAIVFFNTAPQLGSNTKGKRLEKIKKSKNHLNGVFHNPVPTSLGVPKLSTLFEFFKNGHNKRPENVLATHQFVNIVQNEPVITWFGHSTVLISMEGKNILIDPVFNKHASMFQNMGVKKFDYSNEYKLKDLPKVDAVLISHDHYDHLEYTTILECSKQDIPFYVPLGVDAHLEYWGVKKDNIYVHDWWDESIYNSLKFVFVPGRHFSGRRPNNRYSTLWGGWVISSNEFKVFFSGDSGYFNGFIHIGEKYGPFDLAMVECGQYNENWENIHMLPEQAAQAGEEVQSRIVMPIHWGKFNLSLHSWTDPVQRFIAASQNKTYQVFVPEIGKSYTIKDIATSNPNWWKKTN